MAKVSLSLKEVFFDPCGYDEYNWITKEVNPKASQAIESIRAQFLEECRTLGVKVEEEVGRYSFELNCTLKQLKGLFSLQEEWNGCIHFDTPLSEAKCRQVLKLLEGTDLMMPISPEGFGPYTRLTFGSSHYEPCRIYANVKTYEEYCLVMNTIKDVRKNYKVMKSLVKV